MTFTDTEKTDIRRFVGIGVFGNTPEYPFGWRYYQFSGLLEFKINHLQPSEEAIVRKYLATLNKLEDDIPLVADNLDTDRAAVWYHNKNELADRDRLFTLYRKKLASLLQVPYFGGSNNQIKIVV